MTPSNAWMGCYEMGWQGLIVPEAFAHPAKVSRGLIRRIYKHAFDEGWLKHGDSVVDPFGGIAGTALDAMWNRCHWIGVELEPRFVALAEQNIALWQRKFGSNAGWGRGIIIQGDSRQLVSVIAGADLICSSPPFHDSMSNKPSAQILAGSGGRMGESCKSNDIYGTTEGQLGRMKEGTPPSVEMIVGSPPFTDSMNTQDVKFWHKHITDIGRDPDTPGARSLIGDYGSTPGQLGAMPEGKFDAVISSPPFEQSNLTVDKNFMAQVERDKRNGSRLQPGLGTYGKEAGNIGNQSGSTFWTAAREIVAQCHAILRPGGHSIWVCKDFVRKGQRVPFSDQWQALCEAEGFRLVCRHRAMLVAHHGEHGQLFGGSEQLKTERKSFFRRLAEKKGSPAIDWEDVLCLER